MKVATYLPENTPYSMKHCAWNIMAILQKKYSLEFIVFKTLDELPITAADIYWDPRCGGGIAPALAFRKTNKPLVLTVHGMAMFTLPLDTFYFTAKQKLFGQFKRWKERLKWQLMNKHISQVMTVSDYTKSELIHSVNFPVQKITTVWNGIDHNKFKTTFEQKNTEPYFLTIISYQKKKNFERLVEAYKLLDEQTRPKLIALVKPYESQETVKGLKIINTAISEEQLIEYYQHATALVFVSLHEGFGLPIAEAMACGTPVVTSNSTSCIEIAGNAALLVNPKDVNEIKKSLQQISEDVALRQTLAKRGLERAKLFNWENSAEAFYTILQKAKHS
jgi:glycosyltransferase involved in cell wall biosynthesis